MVSERGILYFWTFYFFLFFFKAFKIQFIFSLIEFQRISLNDKKFFVSDFHKHLISDNNPVTGFRSTSFESDPFFRVDFLNIFDIYGIVIMHSKFERNIIKIKIFFNSIIFFLDNEGNFKNMFISISQLPQTAFNNLLQFQISNFSKISGNMHDMTTFHFKNFITGRYFLLILHGSSNQLKFQELAVYGKNSLKEKEYKG